MKADALIRASKTHFVPIVIYGLAVSALYAADVLVALNFSDTYVSEWAITKAVLLLCMASASLGLDQAMVRHLDERRSLFKTALWAAPFSTFMLLGGMHLLGIVAFSPTLWAGGWLLSVVTTATMALRSDQRWIASQLNYASWRFGVFAGVAASIVFGLSSSPKVLMLSAAAVGALIAWTTVMHGSGKLISISPSQKPSKQAIWSSMFFLVDIVIMNLSVSAEQLTFSHLGLEGDSAAYFRASTFVLSPIIFFSTYAVFVIAPVLARRPEIRVLVRRHIWLAALANLVLSAVLGGVGIVLYAYTIHNGLAQAVTCVTLLLVAIGFLRLSQALLAAFITVLASRKRRAAYLLSSVVAMLTYLGVTTLLIEIGTSPILAVACGSLANWSIRAAATASLAFYERR